MTLRQWLRLPKEERILQRAEYRLSRAKENFYNTPKDKRFTFFNADEWD